MYMTLYLAFLRDIVSNDFIIISAVVVFQGGHDDHTRTRPTLEVKSETEGCFGNRRTSASCGTTVHRHNYAKKCPGLLKGSSNVAKVRD